MRYLTLPLLIAAGLLLAGCAERPLPTWEPPLAKTEFQHVRTTAYFDGEADHRPYTNHNALGTTLRTGQVNSAAADWGRWPAGTMFRLLQTGQVYVVDDYGWALAGRNTIDLYEPTREKMDCWGARQVDIQILQWGDPRESYSTLLPRSRYRHVERMIHELRPQLNEPRESYATVQSAPSTSAYEPAPVVSRAVPVQRQGGPVLTPFLSQAQ